MKTMIFAVACLALGLHAGHAEAEDTLKIKTLHRLDDRLMVLDNAVYEKNHYFNEQYQFLDTETLPIDKFLDKVSLKVEYGDEFSREMSRMFPYYTTSEKMQNQFGWSREEWVSARFGDRFNYPEENYAEVSEADRKAFGDFRRHMDSYFLRMDHIVDNKGKSLFEPGLLLHSHRGLRDYTKGIYSEESATERQKAINTVIECVLTGEIPSEFLRDTSLLWNPWKGRLYRRTDKGHEQIRKPLMEGNRRYEGLLSAMKCRSARPDYMHKVFEDGTVSMGQVEKMIEDFLSNEILADVSAAVKADLGRDLQPFDIWYSGFQEQSFYTAAWLDSVTRSRFPSPQAFNDSISSILVNLGFPRHEAEYIRDHIQVRQVISGGYSNQPASRDGFALLTTMFDEKGMDYKSYRVAMHELGHCVCGIYSTRDIDYFTLGGVPNGGVTEAMAELFAYMNIMGLGLEPDMPMDRRTMLAHAAVWYLYEMGGQALTEIRVWKWFNENPDADAEALENAVLSISADVWNSYFSQNFGGIRDSHILSIYNHFITGDLYLHNYFMSNIIMFQIYDKVCGDLCGGLQRLCLEGNTTLSRWMINGLGEDVTPDPLYKVISGE